MTDRSSPRPRVSVTSDLKCLHRGRSIAQADLYETQWQGRRAVLKDFSARPWWVRRWWGRAIAAREVRALNALDGIAGVPQLYCVVSPCAFLMERLQADRLPRRRDGKPQPEFWGRLRALVDAMHARGAAHGDLRLKNVLIGPDGQPYLIDFATAILIRKSGLTASISRFLFDRCVRIDRIKLARMRAYYDRESLTAEERLWLSGEPWYLKIGRLLKRRVYRLRKPEFRRRQWHKFKRRMKNP